MREAGRPTGCPHRAPAASRQALREAEALLRALPAKTPPGSCACKPGAVPGPLHTEAVS